MKNSLFLTVILFLFPAYAVVPGRKYTLITARVDTGELKAEVMPLCREMKSAFVPEFTRMRTLRKRLFDIVQSSDLLGYAEEISYLVAEIKKTANVIEYLANPAWNVEKWDLRMRWSIPRSLLFDESEDLIRRSKIRSGLERMTAETVKFLMTPSPYRTLGMDIDESNFLGVSDLRVREHFFDNADRNPASKVDIRYYKRATALELCQFLETLRFAVKIRFRHSPAGFPIDDEKYFFLATGQEFY